MVNAMHNVFTHGAYFAVVLLLTALIPTGFLGDVHYATNTIFILGFLGTWRYSWALINFTRAIIFRNLVYPRRKARAHARFQAQTKPCHAFFLVTSYMVEPQITVPVYHSIFKAAAQARDGATVVASVVHGADARLIQDIYDGINTDMGRVKLIIDRIPANGKRDALAQTLEIIANQSPTANDIVIFVDGDTCVPLDIVAQSAPMFTNPNMGALTTDEGVIIEKKNLFRDWFILRFNQRQIMMCSMGLSRRVLTLTGRMSVFRADLATNAEFIDGIDHDFLDHWRLGRVNFLTGDDKSTWFWLLKNGYELAYLPDVRAFSMETQPRPGFYDSSKVLMVRWFGNMMRTNGRALRLSPKLIGPFTWWSILDQRVSMWTTLVGPISVLITAMLYSPLVIPAYIAWVMMTRYIFCIIISLFRGTWFPITHPMVLYFGQIMGAIIKTYVFFRLDKQKWTRQGTGGFKRAVPFAERLKAAESTMHHSLALGFLTLAVFFITQI